MSDKEKILLSQEKYNEFKKEHEYLVSVVRVEVQNALKEARAQGDLSENAEYDAARDKQAEVEGRISELDAILENAEIIDTKNINEASGENVISIGATVTYLHLGKNQEFKISIMGSHDSNPFEGKISDKSPLALSMMGAKVGDVVEVDVATKYSIKINKIEFNI